MPWARVDDSLYDHAKILAISNDALAVWIIAIPYCNRKLTDGRLTCAQASYLTRIRNCSNDAINELVTVGLWHKTEDGYEIHDFLEYNNPAEEIIERRRDLSEIRANAGRIGGQRSGEARRQQSVERSSYINEANAKQNRSKHEASASENTPVDEAKPKQTRSPVSRYRVPGTGERTNESADSFGAPSGAAATIPDQLRAFQDRLNAPKAKPVAIVADAFTAFFGREADFGRLGRILKGYNAPYELIKLIVQISPTWNTVDDPHDYLQGTVSARKNGHSNGRGSIESRSRSDTVPPLDIPETEEEALATEQYDREQRELGRQRLHELQMKADPRYREKHESEQLRAQMAARSGKT